MQLSGFFFLIFIFSIYPTFYLSISLSLRYNFFSLTALGVQTAIHSVCIHYICVRNVDIYGGPVSVYDGIQHVLHREARGPALRRVRVV